MSLVPSQAQCREEGWSLSGYRACSGPLGHPPCLTKPGSSWNRVVRQQSRQARSTVDITGKQKSQRKARKSLRKRGWRGNCKELQKRTGQDTGAWKGWPRPSSASGWHCATSRIHFSLGPSFSLHRTKGWDNGWSNT